MNPYCVLFKTGGYRPGHAGAAGEPFGAGNHRPPPGGDLLARAGKTAGEAVKIEIPERRATGPAAA